MNDELGSTQEATPVVSKPGSKGVGKRILLVLLVLVLMIGSAGAAYWWRDQSAKKFEKQQNASLMSLTTAKADLEKQLADAKAQSTAVVAPVPACTSKTPTSTVIGNIEASITSGNTAALEGYMASSVDTVTAASGGLGAKTPTQSVAEITTFIGSDTSAWDYNFSLPASTLSTYTKGSYAKYFPSNAVVGKATNKKVIAFSFDCNAKISTVFMAASEDLLK